MSDRKAIIAKFLSLSEWVHWKRSPIAGDASARRYERLSYDGSSVILMDAPPENGEATIPFAGIAQYLGANGLAAPSILAHDPDNGIMILSDLGSSDFARWLRSTPQEDTALYLAATDVLAHLQTCTPPSHLTKMTPKVGAQMIGIAAEQYAQTQAPDLLDEMESALNQHAPEADTLALRDFHAENLIWRPHMSGVARVGLLDFQDAFIAPKGYDLASLLRDARRDVEPKLAEDMITHFIKHTGQNDAFRTQLACLGAQRNLRILGVFSRLATQMKKPQYIDLIPRVWINLQLDLAHPALATLRTAVQDTLPEPTHALLEKFRQ